MSATSDAPVDPPPTLVTPEADTRLDQLTAEYAALKPQVDELSGRLKDITDAIKTELQQAAPGARQVSLSSTYLERPLRLTSVTSWRLDSKALKAADPHTWVRYAKQSASWRLEPEKA